MVSQLSFWFSSTTLRAGYQTIKMLLPSEWLRSNEMSLCSVNISYLLLSQIFQLILWQHVSPVDERIASSNNGILKCLTRGCLTSQESNQFPQTCEKFRLVSQTTTALAVGRQARQCKVTHEHRWCLAPASVLKSSRGLPAVDEHSHLRI